MKDKITKLLDKTAHVIGATKNLPRRIRIFSLARQDNEPCQAAQDTERSDQPSKRLPPEQDLAYEDDTTPMPFVSEKTRVTFCQRLSKAWRDLAEYFAISSHERERFEAGHECYEVLDWLQRRGKLRQEDLVEALQYIGREELLTYLIEPAATPVDDRPQPGWRQSPYPGLRNFTPQDAPIFFGRQRETDELLGWLADPRKRFIAVIGASGAGKSSLVAAGLIPRLGEQPDGEGWLWLHLTPGEVGDNPFVALATKLEPSLRHLGLSTLEIARGLYARGNLNERVADLLRNRADAAELLLFIDQFEELFTVCKVEYRLRFVSMLAKMARAPHIKTVLTLRADFYLYCADYGALAQLFCNGSYLLAAPGPLALLEMITAPADVVEPAVTFEVDLPERILDDVSRGPNGLALMAYALSLLWDRCKQDRVLTHVAYEGFGGVRGAISHQADKAYRGLNAEARKTAGEVFTALVEVDPKHSVSTRKRALLDSFEGSPAALRLIETFTGRNARLLVRDQGLIEVAHEVLLTHWPQLDRWIQQRLDDLRLRHQVRLAARDWDENGRREAFEWSNERLQRVYAMLKRLRSSDLSEAERAFLRPEIERLREELENPTTAHARRTALGERMSLIGDTRPGVGLRKDGLPDIDWCKVPGGEVTLEKDAGIFPVKPFYIARFPVTYIQYRRFVEVEEGYRNKRWWEKLGYRVEEPGPQRWKLDNYPAERVSWYDAVAFCRWLSEKLGEEIRARFGEEHIIRLPTEWEWEQAATGGQSENVYPWGPKWEGRYANTQESGIRRTTAVGMYPQGASPVGALDMAGNVWTWCLNEYDNPKKINISGSARRVVRGGSWNDSQVEARTALRDWYYPEARSSFRGFRVVCASPIL